MFGGKCRHESACCLDKAVEAVRGMERKGRYLKRSYASESDCKCWMIEVLDSQAALVSVEGGRPSW